MRKVLNTFVVLTLLVSLSLFGIGCDDDDGGDGGTRPSPSPEVSPSPSPEVSPSPSPGPEVEIDEDDIGGTVSSNPPEAGVWVIAETDEVLTNNGEPGTYRKIVVTDDQGRFVIPDLPDATYNVWVRGYGLADSEPVQVTPGNLVDLQVQPAADEQEAAQIYPANYWYSLIEVPADDQFPGTMTADNPGNLIPESYEIQEQWISSIKLGCELCHQLGTEATRLSSGVLFDNGWKKAGTMDGTANGLGRDKAIEVFGDWGERIAAGEVPPEPPRPQGVERNVVITQWEWGDLTTYAHDEVATDKRDPTLYPNGPVYGVDLGNDKLLITDPVNHTSVSIQVPTVGGFDTPWCDQTFVPLSGGDPSPNGFQTLGCPAEGGIPTIPDAYNNPANPHNPMMDATGKVWITTQIRREHQEDYPDFCLDDPAIIGTPEAPRRHHRQIGYYDTNTDPPEFVLIDTCYGTHHLQFDLNGVLWLSGDSYVVGWFDPNQFDPNDPSTVETAQNWSEVVVDSDGDGTADTPLIGFHYGIIPNPVDGTIWTGVLGAFPSRIERYDPATGTHEAYEPPLPGHGPRGVDADTEGNIWTCLGGSGHVAKFDRSQCAQTYGTGDQCPEGWTMWETPGPQMKNAPDGLNEGSADFHYYVWVDQFNTLGLGEDIVVCNGTGSDSLLAFNPNTEEFTVIRFPYPLGFFQRGLDGRIDDPEGDWKDRGWWVNYGIDPILHTETQQGQVAQVQLRTSPLDR